MTTAHTHNNCIRGKEKGEGIEQKGEGKGKGKEKGGKGKAMGRKGKRKRKWKWNGVGKEIETLKLRSNILTNNLKYKRPLLDFGILAVLPQMCSVIVGCGLICGMC